MHQITIISSSIRKERMSHRVALFFKKFIEEHELGSVEILDLQEYDFPIFDQRLGEMQNPLPSLVEFAERIKHAEGILIVTPEYNGGYPASLKNAIDVLYAEWRRKPIGLATVSNGQYGGSQVMTSLLFSLWKIGAWVVPSMFRVGNVQDDYDEHGHVTSPLIQKFARSFLHEMTWCMEAKGKMDKH
ncbi:NAD(P)H-dependent FMN reductase [Hydrobacter penzbergensis]|jgi:NAD(P)H-dependent FMN reductase|uniref:NAD(P)H-dependent FMN reductase n=1 Tax=Hydrobacter penzbergensis TaxID=1235997 RepID=A0A8X8ICV8_9BACT|nr:MULTISPECIES: NAD(P)H-dependent oxidoreductase [Chitinophagaceae]MBN8718520.1 NAD(P)H-dependent oxidoreductase [Sediminibacterium magnilacihabitans]SDW17742.1 NAD(P)H-dependent FMN reductase [Hydrobacter penzbergensis]